MCKVKENLTLLYIDRLIIYLDKTRAAIMGKKEGDFFLVGIKKIASGSALDDLVFYDCAKLGRKL